jgi:hypothetical protein
MSPGKETINGALRNHSSQRLGVGRGLGGGRRSLDRGGDKSGSGVRWIRSYVLAEESGELGTFCVYEADSPEAIRAHAQAADLPVDEVVPIADTVIIRADPAPVAG